MTEVQPRQESRLTSAQIEAILAWAKETPQVLVAFLFGSRAKGTARADSDVDLAIVIEPDAGLSTKQTYERYWIEWQDHLIEDVGLEVHLLRLDAKDTPSTASYVAESGVKLYSARSRNPEEMS